MSVVVVIAAVNAGISVAQCGKYTFSTAMYFLCGIHAYVHSLEQNFLKYPPSLEERYLGLP